jgi:hypothetical protein
MLIEHFQFDRTELVSWFGWSSALALHNSQQKIFIPNGFSPGGIWF